MASSAARRVCRVGGCSGIWTWTCSPSGKSSGSRGRNTPFSYTASITLLIVSPPSSQGMAAYALESLAHVATRLGCPSLIMMVKPSHFRDGDDLATLGWLDGSWHRTIHRQRQMRAKAVIVGKIV